MMSIFLKKVWVLTKIIVSAYYFLQSKFLRRINALKQAFQALEPSLVILLTLRRLMPYIYGAPILDVSRSHTTTQYSR